MAALNLVGAVGIRVRPDTTGFRGETRSKVMRALRGIEGEVDVTPRVKSSKARIRSEVASLVRGAGADVSVKVKLDQGTVRRDMQRVARYLESYKATTVKLSADTEAADKAISEHRDRVEALTGKYESLNRVKLDDLVAAKNKLSKIDQELAERAERLTVAQEKLARAREAADAKGSQKNIQAYEKAAKLVREQVREVERLEQSQKRQQAAVERAVRAQSALQDNLGRKVREEQGLLATRERLYQRQTGELNKQLDVARHMRVVHTGTSRELVEMLESQRQGSERLSATFDRLLAQANALNNVEYKALREWAGQDFARDRVARLRVEADTAFAEAQLLHLERSRTVRLFAHVDSSLVQLLGRLRAGGELDANIDRISKKYANMFSGGARAASSLSSIRRMTDLMVAGAVNMDTMSLSAAKLSTVLISLGGAATATVGGLTAVARDIVALGKGAAVLPAVLAAAGVAFGVSRSAAKAFTDALKEDSSALREVNVVAADTADTLRELFKGADRSGQRAFFAEVESEVARLGETLRPLASLWERAYEAQGKFFRGALSGVNAWYDSGDMSLSVDNISRALENASGAAGPFSQALLDLVTVGSQHLPALASNLTSVSARFAEMVRHAKETGELDRVIRRAGQEVVWLGQTLKNTAGIFGAVGKAAESAGYGGLEAFARGSERINNILRSGLWQRGMADIFAGVADGSRRAVSGLGEVGNAVMSTSKMWREFATVTGDTVGVYGTHIARMVSSSSLLQGTGKFLRDINSAAHASGPLLRNMGDAFGQAASTGGELVKAAQMIADAFFRVWGDLNGLTDGLNRAIPVAAKFAVSVLDVAHVATSALAGGLGAMLSWFSDLPEPMQNTIMLLGVFSMTLGRLRSAGGGDVIAGLGAQFPILGNAIEGAQGKLSMFGNMWRNVTQAVNAGGSFAAVRSDLLNLDNGFSKAERSAGLFALGMRQIRGATSNLGLEQAGANATRFSTALEGAKNVGIGGFRLAAGSLVGFLGGPWGLAFIGAALAFSHFAEKSAEAKKAVSDLRGSLSEAGEITTATVKRISDAFNEMWSDHNGIGWWAERIGESFTKTGMSATQLAQDIANSGGQWTSYRQALADANDALEAQAHAMDANAHGASVSATEFGRLNDRTRELVKQLGDGQTLTAEMSKELFGTEAAAGMTAEQLARLEEEWDKQHLALQAAKAAQEEYARTMGLTTAAGSQLKEAMETINSATSTTAEKAEAFSSAMDVVTGGTRSFLQTVNSQSSAMSSLGEAFVSVGRAGISGADAMVQYTNALGQTSYRLDTTVSELGQLDNALQSSYDATVKQAQSVYDSALAQGKSITEAARAADTTMTGWRSSARDQLVAMGVDAKQAEAYLRDIAGEPWQATLTFMGKTDLFLQAQQKVKAAGKELDGETFTAFLEANPGASMETIQTLLDKGTVWSSARFSASIDMDETKARVALDEISADAQSFTEGEYSATLSGDNSGFLEAYINAAAKGKELDEQTFKAAMGLDDSQFQEVYAAVQRDGVEFGSTEWIARMDLENPGFAEKLFAAQAGLQGLTGTEWQAYVSDNMAEVKQRQEELATGLGFLNGTVAEVSVKSNAAAEALVLEAYRLKAEGLSDKEIQQRLTLDDSEWNTLVDGLPGKWENAKSGVDNNPAKLNADSTDADNKMNSATEKGNQFSLQRFTSKLDGNNQPMANSTQGAHSTGRGFAAVRFIATLSGDNSPFSVAARLARGVGRSFATNVFRASLGANTGGVSKAVNGAISWLNNNWVGRTFNAVLSAVKSLTNADGGFYPRMFANGGFQFFGSGGTRRENHIAMIAAGATPYRVWAEPETGGEAYIPLAASKRDRSEKILGKVAEEFGLTVQRYANGSAEHVGGVPAPVAQPELNYRKLARAVSDAFQGTSVHVSNYSDFRASRARR